MVATDGKTAVDAVRLRQFKRGGLNHPTNGIALSKTAHRLFDRGFWSIGNDFRALVKTERFVEAGDVGQLLKPRAGEEVLLPANRSYWPGREFLAWHRQAHGFEAARADCVSERVWKSEPEATRWLAEAGA